MRQRGVSFVYSAKRDGELSEREKETNEGEVRVANGIVKRRTAVRVRVGEEFRGFGYFLSNEGREVEATIILGSVTHGNTNARRARETFLGFESAKQSRREAPHRRGVCEPKRGHGTTSDSADYFGFRELELQEELGAVRAAGFAKCDRFEDVRLELEHHLKELDHIVVK